MKKTLIHFFSDVYDPSNGWLKEWFIVEDIVTNLSTIKAKVNCIDSVTRILDYSISEFEYTWKINLSELELPKLKALKF